MEKNRQMTSLVFVVFIVGVISAFFSGFIVGRGFFQDYDYEVTFEGNQVEARMRFNLSNPAPSEQLTKTTEATTDVVKIFLFTLDGTLNMPPEFQELGLGLLNSQIAAVTERLKQEAERLLEQSREQQESPPSLEQQRGTTSLI